MQLGFQRICLQNKYRTMPLDISVEFTELEYGDGNVIEYVDENGFMATFYEPYSEVSSKGNVILSDFCLGDISSITRVKKLSRNFTEIKPYVPRYYRYELDAFENLSNLLELNLDGLSALPQNAVCHNINLTSLNTSSIKIFNERSVSFVNRVKHIDLDSAEKLYDNAFYANYDIEYVDLTRNPIVPWIQTSSVFESCGIVNNVPTQRCLSIYVPQNKYQEYMADSKWSQLSTLIYTVQS